MRDCGSLRRLRGRWGVVAGVYALGVAGGAWGLSRSMSGIGWRSWLVGAMLTGLYQLGHVWLTLPLNHRPGETVLFSTFGAANVLTLARGVPQLCLGGLLAAPLPSGWLRWAPSALYSLTIVADHFDGYLARVQDRVTVMGTRLDMAYDSLAIFLIGVLGVRYGVLPWWYLAVPLARPLFVFGIWARRRLSLPVVPLPYTPSARMVAGLQMSFLAIVMLPVFEQTATYWLATFFMVPLIAGFLRDWSIVSMRVDLTSDRYRRALRTVRRCLTRQVPLLLRMLSLPLTVIAVRSWPWTAERWMALSSAVLITLGVAGRTAAVGLLFVILLITRTANVNLFGILLLGLGTMILFVGTGPYTLWAPERRLLLERAGEKRNKGEGCRRTTR
jgi:CDP-diacylglycerol---glycerol-3-phosphate 3-phosphatidyltransferase